MKETKILVGLWISILALCPVGVVTSLIEKDIVHGVFFVGLTMMFYWISGVLIALIKGWKLPKEK